MPRYRRHYEENCWVFLTLVTGNRAPWMREDPAKRQVMEALRRTRARYNYRHLAHVILDDHLHWMIMAPQGQDTPNIVSGFKRSVCFGRRDANLPWRNLWQARYHDHMLRDERDFRHHLDYLHYNPVAHGYVAMARQYRWSSFHAWVERGQYSSNWGTHEPPGIGVVSVE